MNAELKNLLALAQKHMVRSEEADQISALITKVLMGTIECPDHRQDAPLVRRSTFFVPDPQNPKKNIEVVFASFASCLEFQINSLREQKGTK